MSRLWSTIPIFGILIRCSVMGLYCSAAFALTDAEVRSAVQEKMKDRHPGDLQEFWNSLGPEALPALKRWWAAGPNAKEKTWIIDGLSRFQDPEVARLLETEVGITSDSIFKKKVLGALVRSQGEAALEFVGPYLEDADPQIRKEVAESLKKYASDDGRVQKKLAEYLAQEKEIWVKKSVERVQKSQERSVSRLQREGSVFKEPTPTPVPLQPLPEKSWAGKWSGVAVTPSKSSAAEVELKLIQPEALARGDRSVQVWKIELKLPQQAKQEIKESDFKFEAFSSAASQWLELRSKKSDLVLLLFKKAK
jgi:hypothetical protein